MTKPSFTPRELADAIAIHADLQQFPAYLKLVEMTADGGPLTDEVICASVGLVMRLKKYGLTVNLAS